MAPISVALVEDDEGTRERIVRVVRAEPTLSLAFSASTAGEIMHWFANNLVDVLLVDLVLPDLSGLEVIASCCAMQPSCAVMVLTMFGDEDNMLKAFVAGARGYLLKDGTEEDLASHVLALHAGGSPMTPIIARQLLTRWQGDHTLMRGQPALVETAQQVETGERLSGREAQVLDLIARGFTYNEIAAHMAVQISTVHTHVRNIYGKLGVHSKTEAVFEGRLAGWLK